MLHLFTCIYSLKPLHNRPPPTPPHSSNQFQLPPRATLLPPSKNAPKIPLNPRRIPPHWRTRTRHPPPLLLPRLTRKRRKHLPALRLRVLFDVRVRENLGSRGAGRWVQGEQGGEQGGASGCEEGEFGA